MRAAKFAKVIEHIHKMASGQRVSEPTDRQLLGKFAASHDQEAFARLVARHGPMVLRVCRRVLQHQEDAEDAVQAVFIVLASQAHAIRKGEALAAWLHGVAHRTALKAKRTAARRRNHEAAARAQASRAAGSPCWDDVKAVLDEEIQRLPGAFRAAFVVCVLEGKTGREAARELGIPSGTVSSRLTWARKRLQRRLASRGIELTALLAAVSVAEFGQSAMPTFLASRQTFASWIAAAAGGGTAQVSPQVAALASGVNRTLMLTKAKLVLGLAVAAAALTLGGASSFPHATHGDPELPQITTPAPELVQAAQPPAPAEKNPGAMQVYAGRVLDPEGKPFVGAKIYLLYYTPKKLPVPERATSDGEGRFRFDVARESFDKSASVTPWTEAMLVARAEGYGLGLPDFSSTNMLTTFAARKLGLGSETLRLTRDDVPLEGRLLDLEGRPCAGVAVRVEGLQSPKQGTLDGFLKGVQQSKTLYPPMREYLNGFEGWIGRDLGSVLPPTVTDKDGRFVLKGIGRERLMELKFEAPNITSTPVQALTRNGKPIEYAADWDRNMQEQPRQIYPAKIQLALHPSQPIEGVIVDKDSKRPLAGAMVTGTHPPETKFGFGLSLVNVSTIADKDGRYRLTGLPKGAGNFVTAGPADGAPYLLCKKRVADAPGFSPIAVDFQLKRGVWITGRVFDKATGEPIHAQIEYALFEDNAFRNEAPGLEFAEHMSTQADSGVFRFVGLPGHGLVGARPFSYKYPRTDGKHIKGKQQNGMFTTYPFTMLAANFCGLVEIDPGKEQATFRADMPLGELSKRTGTVLDPDGKPISGVMASWLKDIRVWEHEPLPTPDFTLLNVDAGKRRLVEFVHREKNLAGFLVVQGNEKGPLTVRLAPAGTIKGRLVSKDGTPVTEGEIHSSLDAMPQPGDPVFDQNRGLLQRHIRPDKNGNFELKGLAPGLSYKLGLLNRPYLASLGGKASQPIHIQTGKTIDLGDVVVNTIDE
jgi:RNA polymerase sigma factor (sigma-70 family)